MLNASAVDCGTRAGSGALEVTTCGDSGTVAFFVGRGAAGVPHTAQNLSVSRISSPQFVQNIR
jgi:hypothetical protein